MHSLNVSTYPSICPADYSGCVETQKIYASDFTLSFVLIQKKQKIKARDCFLVRKTNNSYYSTSTEPFHPLLSRCFVSDFSTTSKKTRLTSVLKSKHPSAEEHPECSLLRAYLRLGGGCGKKVEEKK